MNKETEAYAKRIGTKLYEIRKEKGKKQIDVCNNTSIHANHLSLIENGISPMMTFMN